VVDHIKPQRTNLAWFYYNASIADWMETPLLIIGRALVAQLSRSPDGKAVAEELKKVYDERAGSGVSSYRCWKLLLELVEVAMALPSLSMRWTNVQNQQTFCPSSTV